jgi:hypothetical protein
MISPRKSASNGSAAFLPSPREWCLILSILAVLSLAVVTRGLRPAISGDTEPAKSDVAASEEIPPALQEPLREAARGILRDSAEAFEQEWAVAAVDGGSCWEQKVLSMSPEEQSAHFADMEGRLRELGENVDRAAEQAHEEARERGIEVSEVEFNRYLNKVLRDLSLDRTSPPPAGTGAGKPMKMGFGGLRGLEHLVGVVGSLLSAERSEEGSASTARGIETDLERLIENLVRVRDQVAPQARPALERAVGNARRLGARFDTKSPAVSISLSPSKAAYGAADLDPGEGGDGISVKVSVRDGLSGPSADPGDLLLTAESDGIATPLPLIVVSSDPVLGILEAEARILADTIPDGHVTLLALARDVAGNEGTATVSFLKDTAPPILVIDQPEDGSLAFGPQVQIQVSWSDAGAGVNIESLVVSVNGEPLSPPDGSVTETGMQFSINLAVGETFTLRVSLADLLGQEATASSTFSVIPLEELVSVQPVLEVVPSNPDIGTIGRCPSDPLRVRVVDASTGRPLQGMLVLFQSVAPTDVRILHRDSPDNVTDADGLAGPRHHAPGYRSRGVRGDRDLHR